MKDLISIIIPVYNSEEFLEECLNSIIMQTYDNLEILVVNDGSNDKSEEVAREFQQKDDRIKLFSKNNTGVSDSRNYALKNAHGKYIAFCDSDDIVHEKYIEILYNTINCNNADLAIIDFSKVYDEIGHISRGIKSLDTDEACLQIIHGNGYLWNKLFSLDIIESNNILFDPNVFICEDQLFIIEYLKLVQKVNMNDSKLYFYRQIEDSALHNRKNIVNNFTEVLAKERMYSVVAGNFSQKCVDASLERLLFTYCNFTKDLTFKLQKEKNRNVWLRYILQNYQKLKEKTEIKIYKKWNIKVKLYYLVLMAEASFLKKIER